MNKKIIIITFLLISGALITYPILYTAYLQYNEQNEKQTDTNLPQGIRLTVVDTLETSMGISWYTMKNASNPRVEYSLFADFEEIISIKPNVSLISTYFIYHANITNLEANKTYFYRVCSDRENQREIMNFTTLSTASSTTRFLIYGDSRSQSEERKMVSEGIYGGFLDRFDFFLHTGDIVEDGRVQEQWNNYFDDTEVVNRYKQGIYVEGNHERGLATKMYDNLLMNSTSENRYYAFSFKEIGFIILNSNPYVAGDDEQTDWLNATLFDYSKRNTYNLVYLHHPILHERIDPYFQESWTPLFDEYNVSLVLCGHNHNYERSFPMTNSTSKEFNDSELYNYTNLSDPIYIVTGGAGAPLYDIYNHTFIAETKSAYSFVLVEIEKDHTETTLTLEAWEVPDNYGNCQMIDNITITKST